MERMKKSFLIYLDNYPMLLELPMEQRGLLLTVLCTYADRICRGEAASMEEVMEVFPAPLPQTRVACEFMGGNILRDTRRWLSQRQARQERRQSQNQGQGRGLNTLAESEREQERVRLDMEQTRRLLERMKMESQERPDPGTR